MEPTFICVAGFPVFYTGGKLAGTPQLYLAEAALAAQRRDLGCASDSSVFIRLPNFAALLAPFGRLPFQTAFVAWEIVSLMALIGAICLWPTPKLLSLLACACCLPLAWNFTYGQDVAFLLLWVASAADLLRKEKPLLAGLVFSLCAAKSHLFLLFLLLVLARGLRRLGGGMLSGTGRLLGVSFAVGGPDWPAQSYQAISHPRVNPNFAGMPNLAGLVFNLPGRAW